MKTHLWCPIFILVFLGAALTASAQSNAWIDVTSYGARTVATVPEATAASCNKTTTITLNVASTFIDGDGIDVAGCGATNLLPQVAAPTVTSALAAVGMGTGDVAPGLTGSTTYDYCLVGRDLNGGLTACSPQGEITTGAATLGPVITNISMMVRSVATPAGSIVTVQTSSPSGAAVGAEVFITNSTDATFSGYYQVATVTDTTHFTYVQGIDTRAGDVVTTATGGTVTVYNANHLTLPSSVVTVSGGTTVTWVSGFTFNVLWATGTQLTINGICTTVSSVTSTTSMTIATSGACPTLPTGSNLTMKLAYQYYVCKKQTGQYVPYGIVRPGELTWDDFGQAPPLFPWFVPATCPTTATNDYLTTTIISGAPGLMIVVANAALQNATGQIAIFDDGPAFVAGYAAAANSPTSNTLHIPPSTTGTFYFINSHTKLEGGGYFPTIISQHPLVLNETVEVSSGVTWTGLLGGSSPGGTGFSWGENPEIQVNTAYPGIIAGSTSTQFNNLYFYAQAQGLVMTISPGGGFNVTFDNDTCYLQSTDTMGMCIVGYGATKQSFNNDTFSVNDSPPYGYSLTPIVFYRNDLPASNGSGSADFENVMWVGRGYLNDSNPPSGAFSQYTFRNNYGQALKTPFTTFGTLNAPTVVIDGFTNDTSSSPVITNLGTSMIATLNNLTDNGSESSGPPGLVSGNLTYGLSINSPATSIGQNVNLTRFRQYLYLTNANFGSGAPQSSLQYFDSEVHIGPDYTVFWPLPAPSGVTTGVATSGGSIPPGTWTYGVTAWGPDGNSTAISSTVGTCTTTMTNGTCTTTWSADTGAVNYSVYRQNAPGAGYNGVVACAHTTMLTCTDSYASAGGGSPPFATTAGQTTIMSNKVITPQIVLSTPLSGGVSSTVAVTAAANKVLVTPSIGQASASQFAGTSACAGSTKAITLPTTYVSQPVILVFDETTKGGANLSAKSTSGFTVSCTGATDVFDWMVVGNPN